VDLDAQDRRLDANHILVNWGMSMRESLFSPLWYRVSNLHPQLNSNVRVQRKQWRDQLWYHLIDGAGNRQFRVNRKAYQFIGRCNGQHSVQDLWDSLLESLGDEALTQDEVINLMAQLDEHEMLKYERAPQAKTLVERRDRRAKKRHRALLNPFAFRVSLGDPSKLIRRLDHVGTMMLKPSMLWIWIAVMIVAIATTASNWQTLVVNATRYMGTPQFLLLAWIGFPVIKALHELGHALAVRRWGGEVHQMGITLLVMVPAPYVDASAAGAFRPKYQRVIVSAVGIMVELTLAALALAVWLNLQPGLVRDFAFVTMFIASVSTVMFNGNPLLPFDGYYVMCDALDLPNLGPRSRAYWFERLRQIALLGPRGGATVQHAKGERKWLIFYAPLSLAYRLFVSSLIVLWVGSYSVVLGTLAALFVLITVCITPLWKLISSVLASAPAGTPRFRARTALAGAALAIGALLFAVPFPSNTLARGVVWLPDQAQVRPEIDGFVAQILVKDGEQVHAGQLLLTLEDPELLVEQDVLIRKLAGLRADHYSALLTNPLQAENVVEEIAQAWNELQRVEERLGNLAIRANMNGRLVMPRQADLIGSLARRGDTLGYVLVSEQIRVRAALSERDAALVRDSTRSISVRLDDAPEKAIPAQLIRDVPAATHDLPSRALGDRGGGPYATDPADENGLRTIEPVILVDLKLPKAILQRVGGRAWVRYSHGATPIASQCYRLLRQLFLQHFNPAG
jgi:putative peptide zinc metalloprotease protein